MMQKQKEDFLGIDEIINNLINQKSNEEYLARTQAVPQKQAAVPIEGKQVRPIELPDGVVATSPQQQTRHKVFNDAIEPQVQVEKDLGANLQGITQKVVGLEDQMKDNLNKIGEVADRRYVPDPELQRQLDRAEKESEGEAIPQTDMLTHAILSLAPAFFGAVTGEDGAISQVKGGENARNIYNSIHKEDVDRVKLSNTAKEKRYERLLKMKTSGQEALTKAQQLEMDKLKAQIGGAGDLLKAGVTDMSKTEDNLLKTKSEIAKTKMQGAENISKGFEKEQSEANSILKAKINAENAGARLKVATDGERKAAMQAGGMFQAEKNMIDLKKKNGGIYPSQNEKFFKMQKEIATGNYGSMTLSELMNSNKIDSVTRQQIQIERSFLEAIGRINSGAAVSLGEWLNFREQYFPNYGDDEQTIAQKEQQRNTAMAGVKVMAGRSAKDIPQAVQVIQPNAPVDTSKMSREQKIKMAKELGHK